MDNYIRKYHVRWKDTIYRPEAVYPNLDCAVRVLKEKYEEQHKAYGAGHYAQSLEQAMELSAYVYVDEENARKYISLRKDYIWNGWWGIENLDKHVEEYKEKYLEAK